MSGSTGRAAAEDYSRGSNAIRRGSDRPGSPVATGRSRLWWAGAGLVAIGVLGLLAATVLPVIEYRVPAGTPRGFDTSVVGWERSGPLLPLVALVALALAGTAMRGDARPAVAIAGLGVVVVVLAIVRDAPRLDETIGAGPDYADASSGAGLGWFAQTGGAVALLVGGAALAAAAAWSRGAGSQRPAGGSGRGPGPGAGDGSRERLTAPGHAAGDGGGWAAADWAGDGWTGPRGPEGPDA